MSFRPGDTPLIHILQSIQHIREFLGDMTFEQYQQDHRTRSAVERMFQILTEAAIRLGNEAAVLSPEIDWRGLRLMGNFLRHSYERVEDLVIWDAIHVDLPPLEAAVRVILDETHPGWSLDHA